MWNLVMMIELHSMSFYYEIIPDGNGYIVALGTLMGAH